MIVLWTDWHGETFGFCSHRLRASAPRIAVVPGSLPRSVDVTVSFGCWWCGRNLSGGVVWLRSDDAGERVT